MLLNRRNAGAGRHAVFHSGWATLILAAGLAVLTGQRCSWYAPGLNVTATVSPTSGAGSVTVTLTVTATGGTLPYTYAWTASPATTITDANTATATATVTTTTTFAVTVMDADGNAVTDTATVTVTAPPMAVLAHGPPSALGCDAFWLTAEVTNETPPVSFSWLLTEVGTDGTGTLWDATSQTATARLSYNASGDFTFQVTATDARGSASDTIVITATPTCPCGDTTFTVSTTDHLIGEPGDDRFDGTLFYDAVTDSFLETVDDGDSADGLAGTDVADIEIEEGTSVNPTLTSIETLNITVTDANGLGGGAVIFDASKTTGMTALNAANCTDTLNVTHLAAIPNVSMTDNSQDLALSFAGTAVSGSIDMLDLTLSSVSGGTFTVPATIETVHVVSSGSAVNVLTGLSFIPSAGTTPVGVIVTGDQDLSLGTMSYGSPIDAGAFTGNLSLVLARAGVVIGGSGTDTITGSDSPDNLSGGAGADTITGGPGNDVLAGGTDADSFVFAQTAAVNDRDSIVDFTTSDILDFAAFATADAPAGTVADTSTGNQTVASNDIWVVTDADGSIDAAVEVAALFGGGGKPFAAGAAGMHVVLLVQDGRSGGDTGIWYVDDADSNTTVATDECVRVATLVAFNGSIEDANIAD